MNFSKKNHEHKNNNRRFVSKTLQLLIVMLVLCISNLTLAQNKEKSKIKDTTQVKKDNFLDLQADVMTDILGSNLDGKSDGKTLNFLQLLEKMDLPAEQKTEWKNWYYLQAKNLTEKQKDSLGKAIAKKLKSAQNKPK